MATSEREVAAVGRICKGLQWMLGGAGVECKVTFDRERETINVKTDGVTYVVNVSGDSPAGALVDVFEQLGRAIKDIAY